MNQPNLDPKLTDIFVVVHGIGEQQRFATVRSVANRLAASRTLRAGGRTQPVAPQPLGYFHSDVRRLVETRLVDDRARLVGATLETIGVAEVFWADIPSEVEADGRTMEETKAWAHTVMARARALFEDAREVDARGLVPPDFSLASEVLDEMVQTIYVLENICVLAAKAGLFTFDLRQVLEDYLGDVQVVAEFGYYRTDIVGRFHRAIEDVYAEQVKLANPGVRLHVVAHSEGTVVSFLGLLRAMSGHRVIPDDGSGDPGAWIDREAGAPAWLAHVAGYMTIGSPIDKHLLLWPRLWTDLAPARANALLQDHPIKWRNYYDHGDPVGFKLDTARLWLGPGFQKTRVFEFEEQHDIGFARYVLPGKAHNDYWNDSAVFEHFIDDVVKPTTPPAPPPKTKPLVAAVSPALPYALSFIVLMTGTYFLYKQVSLYAHPEPAPLEAAEIYRQIGVVRASGVDGVDLLRQVVGVAALVAGSTLLARLPRVAAGFKWKVIAFAGYLAGAAAYWLLLARESRQEIGAPFGTAALGGNACTLGVCLLGLVVGLIGSLANLRGRGERRDRWFWKGMRPLIACGAAGVLFIVASRAYPGAFGTGTPLAADESAFIAHYIDRTNAGRSAEFRQARLEELTGIIADAGFTRAELDPFFGRLADGDPIDADATNRHLARLPAMELLLGEEPPIWPVVLATAAFLYLWWLATLIFDLAFVWHRYIRASVANKRLRQWFDRKETAAPFARPG